MQIAKFKSSWFFIYLASRIAIANFMNHVSQLYKTKWEAEAARKLL